MATVGVLTMLAWGWANPESTSEPFGPPTESPSRSTQLATGTPTASEAPGQFRPSPSLSTARPGGLPTAAPPGPTPTRTGAPPTSTPAPPTSTPAPPTSTPAPPTSTPAPPTPTLLPTGTAINPPAGGSPVLIGAGDICITSVIAHASATADIISANPNAVVFTAGDNSNETGSTANYTNCVAKSWGVFKSRIHPVPGNHDYMTSGAGPYYAYFGAAAGPAGKGYYSYNLANNWHVVALNAMCSSVGGCQAGSPEETFLRNDLAANAGKHVIAIWHIPSFSSGGEHGNNPSYLAWWQDLYAAHADIVIDGHDHDYERFGLQSPAGKADPNGIREFVVGTGGAGQRPFGTIRANSQVRSTGTFGVLQLTLGAHSYSWRFIPITGGTFTDSGTQATHG
jgi:acid phosphatase type 7